MVCSPSPLSAQVKAGESVQMKHEKDSKPVSLRVRDAAELLLTSLVEHVGNFPSPCGAQSLSCLLDEATLLHQSPLGDVSSSPGSRSKNDLQSAVKNFRYFVAAEGAILLSVLEQPLGNDQGLFVVPLWLSSGGSKFAIRLEQIPNLPSLCC